MMRMRVETVWLMALMVCTVWKTSIGTLMCVFTGSEPLGEMVATWGMMSNNFQFEGYLVWGLFSLRGIQFEGY